MFCRKTLSRSIQCFHPCYEQKHWPMPAVRGPQNRKRKKERKKHFFNSSPKLRSAESEPPGDSLNFIQNAPS